MSRVLPLITEFIKTIFSWMPASAPIFIYTKVLAIPPLSYARDTLIKSILPHEVTVGTAVLEINPADAVISAALTFGVYEPYETKLLKNTIQSGMTVVDIGANIGYYAVIAGLRAGPTGRIVAYEPDPTNMSFLRKNLERNGLTNAVAVQKALSDRQGTALFYLTKHNKGTHSLANNRDVKETIEVETDTLDFSLSALDIRKVDVLKIDIEGAEPLAFEGMRETLTRNKDIIVFTEFYPKAMRRLGKDPVAFLKTFDSFGFSIKNIDEDRRRLTIIEPSDFVSFVKAVPLGERVKNLFLQR